MLKLFFIMLTTRRFKRKYPYNRKYRYNIKDIYSPSLYGAPIPNYYQMKGRTIQVTPRNMQDVSPFMINEKMLHEMYNTLVDYKFKFPIKPSLDILPFMINTNEFFFNIFPIDQGVRNNHFDNEGLTRIALTYLNSNFSQIANLYTWTFQLMGIQFNIGQATPPIDNDKQYSINWNSRLLAGDVYTIFLKNLNEGIGNNFHPAPITNKPAGISPETGKVVLLSEQVIITYGGYVVQTQNINSNDFNITDNGQYPFIDTDDSHQLYQGELEFIPSTGMQQGDISTMMARLFILCFPVSRIEE